VVVLTAGCGEEVGDACVSNLDLQCTPQHAPTFSDIFDKTLRPTCTEAGFCHASDPGQAGLVFEDEATAYGLVLDSLVVPGDASCSQLVKRLEAEPADAMPPGAPLRAGERCAIIQWIEAGAER